MKRAFVNGTIESQIAVLLILVGSGIVFGYLAYHNPENNKMTGVTDSDSLMLSDRLAC